MQFQQLYISSLFWVNIHLHSIRTHEPKYRVFANSGCPEDYVYFLLQLRVPGNIDQNMRVKLMPAQQEGKWVASAGQSAQSKQLR